MPYTPEYSMDALKHFCPTIIRSPADAQALSADRWGYMRRQQLNTAPGVEPSLDEMLRDYMRTQPPVAPDDAIIAPVGEVTAEPLPPVAPAASGG